MWNLIRITFALIFNFLEIDLKYLSWSFAILSRYCNAHISATNNYEASLCSSLSLFVNFTCEIFEILIENRKKVKWHPIFYKAWSKVLLPIRDFTYHNLLIILLRNFRITVKNNLEASLCKTLYSLTHTLSLTKTFSFSFKKFLEKGFSG